MSCFGSRFLLAKPAGCKVAACAHPHPFAQVHRLMIEPDWLMKEPPKGSFPAVSPIQAAASPPIFVDGGRLT